jgi:hypothetical protein
LTTAEPPSSLGFRIVPHGTPLQCVPCLHRFGASVPTTNQQATRRSRVSCWSLAGGPTTWWSGRESDRKPHRPRTTTKNRHPRPLVTRSVSEGPRAPRRSRFPRNPRHVPRSRVGFSSRIHRSSEKITPYTDRSRRPSRSSTSRNPITLATTRNTAIPHATATTVCETTPPIQCLGSNSTP